MLEIKGLSVKAGVFFLNNISFRVEDRSTHVIIGPTGSGKTILLETIIGLKKPERGEIRLNDRNITNQPTEQRQISYLPQDLAIFPHLNVKDNIFYGLNIKKAKDKHHFSIVNDLIETLKIGHLLDRTTHNLSGGERQRVALVRAIATGNKHLLLDEPCSALHTGLKKELWFLIKDLQERYRLTVLMVTHDVEEAFFHADTISIIINGRIEQTGRKDEVYRHPATIEVSKFFGIRNLFEADIIESTDDKMIVGCNDLNSNLTIPLRRFTDPPIHRFTIGIRAEDVMILRPDLKRQVQDNLISGTVIEIFKKGASHIILFLPEKSKKSIEIDLPNYAFQKLNILKGQQTTVSLKGEDIFLLRT